MSDRKYIPGYGSIGAKLMVIGECPTYSDIPTGTPFSGAPGKELDHLLKDAGMHRSEVWLSNVSKYEVTPNRKGAKAIPFHVRAKNDGLDLDEQLRDLQTEITSLKPNCILALGSTALWALSGKKDIGSYRGSILHGMGCKFIPTYNPANLLFTSEAGEFKGYWNRQIMICDFKRAKKQSEFPELRLPQRVLQICRSSFDLVQFLDRWKHKRRMAVDIEANGTCIPVCIGISFDKSHGMTVPLWNAEDMSMIPTADLVQIWLILARVLAEMDIVGQNFNYDRDKIKRLGFIVRKLVSDVMLKAHAINPELPKGLGFNTSVYTEEPFYKNEGMYQGALQDLYLGCARDACVTIELDEVMEPDLIEVGMKEFFDKFLMKLPDFYWDIERQGFNIDIAERDMLLRKYISWDERVRHELYSLCGTEINVNSPKQIKSLLFENFKLPPKHTTGEEDLTALLNSPTAIKKDEHRRVCELILEGRRVRKSISTYLMALPDYDGRMRTTYFPCLDTGRSSTGQQDPPIRPTLEVRDENNKKKDKVLGTAFQTMTKHGDIGADIRGMYVPDYCHIEVIDRLPITVIEPETFVQADSSQAEARVVWLLADDEEALKLVDSIDYHALTASWFFGGTESDYSKKVLGYEHPIRFAGKTLRHAGHLGAGKRRASISVNTDARKYKIPIQISEAIAERALKIFHSKQPKIQQVFQNGIVEILKRHRSLIAPIPFGMGLRTGGRRMFFERWGEDLFRQAFSYIPQRAVTDNTKAAGIRIKERIPLIKIVMESHDALLFSIPDSKVKEYCPIIKEEFERVIDFSTCSLPRRELIIPCEIETGKNYRDLKKFRDLPMIMPPIETLELKPKTMQELFQVVTLPPDTRRDKTLYHHIVEKKL
jgi:uracil-DNA glycosylase family 4